MSMEEKVYTLDVSKWRCGGGSINSLGEGSTGMLNKEGYSCCLGQFSEGLVPDSSRLFFDSPENVAHECGLLYDSNFVVLGENGYENTSLAYQLMAINDCSATSPAEKIKEIRVELEARGWKLRVLNEELLHPHKENRDQKGEEDEDKLLEAP